MNLLRQLRKEGFEVILGEDNRVGIRPADRITPELAKQVRKHKAELIEALRAHQQADQYSKPVRQVPKDKKNKNGQRYCPGYECYIHMDSCSWHVRKADPRCLGCKYLTRKQREIWMDSYLNNVILRLNAFYRRGDKIDWDRPGARQQVDELERLITLTFLRGDLEAYVNAVDKLERCFKQMRK